jgi:hypothetical protein
MLKNAESPFSIGVAIAIEEAIQNAGHPLDIEELDRAIPGKSNLGIVSGAFWVDMSIRGHLTLTPERKIKIR